MPDCDKPPRSNQRYCARCHSKYMKTWRAKRRREALRLQASVLQMRSKIVSQQRELDELKA